VWKILRTIEYGTSQAGPSPDDIPAYLGHELATGVMWVAEEAGAVIGYAALIVRATIAFIAELFVRPECQSNHVGAALLRRLLSVDASTFCTMSSGDRRAMGLYIRSTLRPRWPHFHLVGAAETIRAIPHDLDVADAAPGDGAIVTWDAEIGGRRRPQEHAFWRSTDAMPLWCLRNGSRVGYGYTHHTPAAGARPAAVILGPIGARTPRDAEACIAALLDRTRGSNGIIHVGVPAAHPCLPLLLDAGFRIRDVETYCSMADASPFNPRLYVPSTTLEGTALL